MYPTFMITTFIWVIFHSYRFYKLNKDRRAQNLEPVSFFNKETSSYCIKKTNIVADAQLPAEDQYELSWGALMVPIRRFVINLSIYVMLGLTFMYADKCGIHTGVITSLFCSSLIFTIAYFYFKHDQNLQISDWIGIILVIVCVGLISASEGGDEHGAAADPLEKAVIEKKIEEEEEGFDWDKFLTIVFALITGLVFSTNSIEMHYSTKTQNVPATVMNVDGNFILGMVVLPFFIVEMSLGTVEYSTLDLILANANIICIIIASTGLTAAMAVGQAGPVQAIEMMKTVW